MPLGFLFLAQRWDMAIFWILGWHIFDVGDSPWSIMEETKGILFPSTLKIWERKVPLFFQFWITAEI